MAGGPVGAVIGVASGISSMSQQSKQRRLAEAQANAQAKAAEASAALRQVEINSRRDYADYNAKLNSLTRQFQYMQSEMGLRGQGIMDQMNQTGQLGQLQMSEMANQMGLVNAEMGADQQVAGAKQQELGQKTEAAGASVGSQNQLTNAAQQTGAGMQAGEARRAMMQTLMSATGGAPGRTSAVLEQKDLDGSIAAALAQNLQQEGISEQDLRQLLYTRDIAEISKALNINAAEFQRESARRGATATSMGIAGMKTDLATQAEMSNAGRDAALKQMRFAQMSDANADAVNKIFAEYGFQQQSNATQSTLAAQTSQINAQVAATKQSGPGLFDYLGMAVKGYGMLQGSGIFGGGGQQQQGAGYSLFSGYKVNPMTSVDDPLSRINATTQSNSSNATSFTQLPF